MNLQPLEDRIVVRPAQAEATTASGLVIPDTAKEKPQQGEVLAVGEGRFGDDNERIPMEVKVGDKVVYSSTAAPRSPSMAKTSSSSLLATCSRSPSNHHTRIPTWQRF